jgi:cytochrome c peroxidase
VKLSRIVAVIATGLTLSAVAWSKGVPAPGAADQVWRLGKPLAPPPGNETTPARVALGKALFFDPRLSGNGSVSCASCHNPGLGWSDGLAKGIGINGARLGRNSPTVVNTVHNTQFMWDGRARSLEDQALGPLRTQEEMSADFPHMRLMLQSLDGYRAMFEAAYPGQPIDESAVARALAAFERTLVSDNSRFDRWLKGDRKALTAREYRGYQLFKTKANCAVCHSGPNFTDNGFHNIGLRLGDSAAADIGRYKVKPVESMKGAFKTPTLRDVALTAPYFRDGSAATLREVVEHYNRGGDEPAVGKRSPEIRPLQLSAAEVDDLVAFMQALTGRQAPVTIPQLPR